MALFGCGFRLPGDDRGLIPPGISVRNATDVTLHFKVFTPERTYSLPTVVRPSDSTIVLSKGQLAPAIAEGECTIVDLVAFALRAHRTRQRIERLVAGSRWVDCGHVFTTMIGTPLHAATVTRAF
jgi:hypothetical protein